MPRPSSRLALVAAAVLPFAAACSSSATDPSRNAGTPALSASEAGSVATGLLSQASVNPGTATRNSDGSYSYAAACPKGGTITSVFSIGSTTRNGDGSETYTAKATVTPQACVVSTGTRQISITGDPSEVVNTAVTVAGTSLVSSTSTVSGGFKWDGGGCQMSYTATTKLSGSTQTITVVGNVCGQSVNDTRTF